MRRYLGDSAKVRVGVALLTAYLLVAIFGPLLTGALGLDPHHVDPEAVRAAPSGAHWLGTDASGQDVFAQLILGARGSVFVGAVAGLLMTAIALVVGVTAGFLGGIADLILNAFINLFLVLPVFALTLIVAGYLEGAGLLGIALIIGIFGWPAEARAIRAQTLSLRNRDFVAAARMIGESRPRLIFAEVLPHLSGWIFTLLLNAVVAGVFAEAALHFLGIGNADAVSWGTMLGDVQNSGAVLAGMWWWFIPPGLAIALLGTATALVNFGVDELANPKLRMARRAVVRRMAAASKAGAR
ncbi:ABC transporter permease [Hamadaea sp. NPDC051192]|uniref:ABC transporter permease n=1 Tax=Hamadaea sp. NPDC051192 TaxID=3154940 RepID=UPI003427F48F